MSKRKEKPEQKSPPKTEIKKGSRELADEHLDTVTGGANFGGTNNTGVESITLVHEGAKRTK